MMTRDTGEQRTRSDLIDFDNIGAPDSHDSDYRSVPCAVADHGRQPRLPKRPTLVVYKRDPDNLYKPADNPFAEPSGDRLTASERRKTDVARLLVKTARDHAPRLSWRHDDAISHFIETEALPDARFVASSLPADDIPKVLDQFVEVLWVEIDQQRKFASSRKRECSAKNPAHVKSMA